MNISLLFGQIVLMFCLMLLGLLANKLKFIHEQTANDLTNILLYLVSPCLIIKSFMEQFSADRLKELLLITLAMILIYSIQILSAKLIFNQVADLNLRRIAQFGSIYSNAGFIGIPLVSSLFGNQGVFFAVVPIVFFNIFNWTHGVSLFRSQANSRQSRSHKLKQVIFNPNIIAILIGLLVFVCSIKLPRLIMQVVTDTSSINTPLSMMVIGNSLANIRLKNCKLNRTLMIALILRNLLYPLLTVGIVIFLGISGVAQAATILMMACPVAGIVVLFTLQNHAEVDSAITLMSLSTILSLVTIPVIFMVANVLM